MKFFILLFVLSLCSCSGQKLEDYAGFKPSLDLHQFFKGKLVAKGIVQDRSGKVLQRFRADIEADWKGPVATLDESFVYADGTTSKRIWTLTEKANSEYIGVAHDVIGEAKGVVKGNTFYFEYVLNLKVDESEYEVTFSDWMYLLDERTLLARSYMTKFGINVGEVTLVMTREE